MRSLRLAALVGLVLVACGVHVTDVSIAHRSGPLKDDCAEEPLVPAVKKYEHALEVSNAFLEALKARDFARLRSSYLGPPLDVGLDDAKLAALLESAETNFGAWTATGPLQWNVATEMDGGVRYLYSTKIAEHEHGRVRYRFVFADDGKYERMVGFQSRAWKGPLGPGEI